MRNIPFWSFRADHFRVLIYALVAAFIGGIVLFTMICYLIGPMGMFPKNIPR